MVNDTPQYNAEWLGDQKLDSASFVFHHQIFAKDLNEDITLQFLFELEEEILCKFANFYSNVPVHRKIYKRTLDLEIGNRCNLLEWVSASAVSRRSSSS